MSNMCTTIISLFFEVNSAEMKSHNKSILSYSYYTSVFLFLLIQTINTKIQLRN